VRRILIITGSRGEYGYIRPVIRAIEREPSLRYEVLATNMHLLPEFGFTVREFERDGIEVAYRPAVTLAGYTPATMMKSLSLFGISITDILEQSAPDFILLAGDRGEQLVAAIAGAHLGIPVAHIQAGERSGNIDGLSRHAIARFAHIHFAANDDAAERLRKSGEQEFRIFNVGAPQLDEFLEDRILDRAALCEKFRLDQKKPFLLVVHHPVTEEFGSAGAQAEEVLTAVNETGLDAVVIYPNSDAGSSAIQAAIRKLQHPRLRIHRSLPREEYASLMAEASVLVGNSSSGLIEAPSFELPAVNVGRRQNGRVRGRNVIDCGAGVAVITAAIRKAMAPEFRVSLKGMANPYGDGRSSRRIVEILKSTPVDEKLMLKDLTY
jgi:UDP-hydrolysing UDP-N-acetyl-D-glucosamine 2-epimerase